MFGQLKDLYNLQKQAREMKKQLEEERATGSAAGISLTINGSYELVDVKVAEGAQLAPAELESAIRQAYNDANSQLKKVLAEKFRGMM